MDSELIVELSQPPPVGSRNAVNRQEDITYYESGCLCGPTREDTRHGARLEQNRLSFELLRHRWRVVEPGPSLVLPSDKARRHPTRCDDQEGIGNRQDGISPLNLSHARSLGHPFARPHYNLMVRHCIRPTAAASYWLSRASFQAVGKQETETPG